MLHVNVVIVGAGLSGIGAACHLQRHCPGKSYMILEARGAIGGTWDLFRYPGIRSDSDMYTLGYIFKPWTDAKAIADGPSILRYVRETAAEHGVDQHIRFHHQVQRADWSSAQQRWVVQALHDGAAVEFSCDFLLMCSGYYDYENGYSPDFPGLAAFGGQVIHPQHWPENLDYSGRKIVVIGSGATAVTLVPELARKAACVTMLQRSPTYVVARPAHDRLASWLRGKLPGKLAYSITRWYNVLLTMYLYHLARAKPARVKQGILDLVRARLGPEYDLSHFTPSYNPWDQRLCLVPDGDLFESIKAGKADIVTGTIAGFTASGIKLASGQQIPAEIIVTATGLQVKFIGGLEVWVDGSKVDFPNRYTYKGMMYNGVPNFVSVFGYTNASWTLKADLTSAYVCRLLNYMRRHDYAACAPALDGDLEAGPFLTLTSGYISRAAGLLPKQGQHAPWRVHQNYARDLLDIRFARLDDGIMRFVRRIRDAKAA